MDITRKAKCKLRRESRISTVADLEARIAALEARLEAMVCPLPPVNVPAYMVPTPYSPYPGYPSPYIGDAPYLQPMFTPYTPSITIGPQWVTGGGQVTQ